MNGEEVRKLKNEEIQVELGRLRMSLFDLRSQTVTDKVGDNSQFRKVRKDIARLLTERRSRQIAKAPVRHVAKVAPVAKAAVVKPTAKKPGTKAASKVSASKGKK
jgi:large subunit ribosomal protein L29